MVLQTAIYYLLSLLVILFTATFFYFKHNYGYWEGKNVAYLQPSFPFGNMKDFVFIRKTFPLVVAELYNEIKKKTKTFGGVFMFSKPTVLIVDPEMIKDIVGKDFSHFHDRGIFHDEDTDPLSAHLVALGGEKWKTLRAKLTPTFTSGKMRIMFQTLLDSSSALGPIIEQHIKDNRPMDMKEIFARLTTDTIGSCAFGLDCNSLNNPDAEFRKYGQKVFQFGLRESIITIIATCWPNLLRWFRIPQTSPDVTEFYMRVLKETVDYREKNQIRRKDFLDLLIRLKNNQSVLEETSEERVEGEGITFNQLAAEAFIFIVAGFETTSSTLNFCLFELSNNLNIQEKAREEVKRVLKANDGKITYEAIREMKYVDKVFNEVLRKYPPIGAIFRECTEDYEITNSNVTIEKGTAVILPIFGLQNDPEYFPDPEKFDPERFSDEQKATRHPYAYLPFGEGPRTCIGMRFALLQVKIVLATLLKDYSFTLDPKTVTPVEYTPTSVFLSPLNTFWIQAHKT